MIELDVSGSKFDYVDFTEAHLFLREIPEPNQNLELRAWGVTLLSELKELYGSEYSDDIYIAGFCDIIFEKVIYAEIMMAVYKSIDRQLPYLDEEGNDVMIRGRWGDLKFKESSGLYIMGGSIEWPSAHSSQFDVYSNSKVIIKYNKENAILAEEYCRNPRKYSYKHYNSRS